jgi:hypothetical protein
MSTSSAPVHETRIELEHDVPGMSKFLDSLKYNPDGLVAVMAQVGPQDSISKGFY